jgi:mannose-6-phosphate isomerase-like protein (cupin superfamily)
MLNVVSKRRNDRAIKIGKMTKKLDYKELTKDVTDDWKNFPICEINDHLVRLSVIQKDFHWHKHEKSDEFFFVIEGELYVDFEDKTETLASGQMIKVAKNILHRTRSKKRTKLLCFETIDNDVTGD